MIGYKTIDRMVLNGNEGSTPVRERELVMEPSELSDKLGTSKKGVKALILGGGEALILEWPYSSPVKLREASMLACWLYPQSTKVLPDIYPQSVKQAAKPRIKLRKPTTVQLKEMAVSGTDVLEAGEEVSEMTGTAMGGHHESH